MITLFRKTISESHKKYPQFSQLADRCISRDFPLEITGPKGFYLSYILSELFSYCRTGYIIVTPTEKEGRELYSDLIKLNPEMRYFPEWGKLPYSDAMPALALSGERVAALSTMTFDKQPKIVCSLRNWLTPLPPPGFFSSISIELAVGREFNPQIIEEQLTGLGYLRVPKVSIPGEFALRGEVLDIFMTSNQQPVRIVFDFDVIDEIKFFDPITQSSVEKADSVRIQPLKEIVWTEERVQGLQLKMPGFGIGQEEWSPIIEVLETHHAIGQEELLFPLSFETAGSLIDYGDEETVIIFVEYERLRNTSEVLLREYEELFRKQERENRLRIPPSAWFPDFAELETGLNNVIRFPLLTGSGSEEGIHLPCEPARSFFGNLNYLKEELHTLSDQGYRIFVFSESENQRERIAYLMKDTSVEIMEAHISAGFTLPELKLIVIQENEIFGRRRHVPASVKKSKSRAIETFVDLNPSDYVVHINYGIGKFLGIERVQAVGTERDYIKLLYAGEESVYIPIEQVNLVQRYIGSEGNVPRLDKLGGKSWENRKKYVRKSVENLAGRLIQLYSKRQKVQGYPFPADTDWQIEFEAGFPFEETADQLTCIEDVKSDMESAKPMDRLVCGDVGYGKTEIAMRAAFKAVLGGKQVAYLAPTTILVEQHYENFLERFKRFPVQIAMISRFIGRGEQKKITEKISGGDIDLVIGTHRLLQKDISFKNLGLLIIDEEQRFGVKHKERLKELKTSVDCLTLSATPIPRTLHMSLLKIRDMSILETPPQNRLPIQTHIGEFDEGVIRDAVIKEIERGGQIFFLHNRIETLDEIKLFLEQLIPEALIEMAHGRMNSRELEDIMHRFIHGGFHILLSTTIIENGIDIPNVNTIIIDRADMYGISQLYQLRGRVGRSDRAAFAFLLYPGEKVLTELAMKRLRIISDNTSLGSGFKIALKDLEVRGAGNLLGREQHGDVLSVGFDMYLRLLDEAIAEMTEEGADQPPEVYLELEYSGFIPDSYIRDIEEKMEIYKKIASVTEEAELGPIVLELEDRFGPFPAEVASLLSLAEIRIICKKLWISSLKERKGQADIEFAKVSVIPVDRILRLIKESGGKISLDSRRANIIVMKTEMIGLKEKSEYIREKLSFLL